MAELYETREGACLPLGTRRTDPRALCESPRRWPRHRSCVDRPFPIMQEFAEIASRAAARHSMRADQGQQNSLVTLYCLMTQREAPE